MHQWLTGFLGFELTATAHRLLALRVRRESTHCQLLYQLVIICFTSTASAPLRSGLTFRMPGRGREGERERGVVGLEAKGAWGVGVWGVRIRASTAQHLPLYSMVEGS